MGKTIISFPVIAVLISQQNRIVSPQDTMSEDDSPAPENAYSLQDYK